jgi:ABC-type Fe3+-siderophore transport system permease subunit
MKKKFSKPLFLTLLTAPLGLLFFPIKAFALVSGASCSTILAQNLTNLQGLISASWCLIYRAIPVVIGLAFLFFLWGLMKFILVAGDEKAKEEGKRIMIWGTIALFVMVSIWGIVNIIQGDFGITFFYL